MLQAQSPKSFIGKLESFEYVKTYVPFVGSGEIA
jgi:hypothetical protein